MRDVEEHLAHLYAAAFHTVHLPLVHRAKIRRMIAVANKHQIRLAREIKRTLCLKCHRMLIPGISCESMVVRRLCGLCLVSVCGCGSEKVFVMKNR